MTNISEIILIIVIIEYVTNESAEYTDPRANSQEKRAKSESLKFKPRCINCIVYSPGWGVYQCIMYDLLSRIGKFLHTVYCIHIQGVPVYFIQIKDVSVYFIQIYNVPVYCAQIQGVPEYCIQIQGVPVYCIQIQCVPVYCIQIQGVPVYVLYTDTRYPSVPYTDTGCPNLKLKLEYVKKSQLNKCLLSLHLGHTA